MNILITGANRGLGLALTKMCLKNGDTVLASMRKGNYQETLDALCGEFPETLKICSFDVTSEEQIVTCAKQAQSDLGSLDVIVNNAAILKGNEKRITEIDPKEIFECFDVNTLGAIRVVKHFVPLLYYGTRRVVVNVSSEAGSFTTCGHSNYAYAISKAAMNMFSAILRNDLSKANVTVMSVHPGRMRTDMGREDFPDSAEEAAAELYTLFANKRVFDLPINFVDRHGFAMPL